jgi:hypothetical protein
MTFDKLNPSIRCPIFSLRKSVLRGWWAELTQSKKGDTDSDTCSDRVRRVLETRVQHGAKKTEVKVHLPARAVQNTGLRR